MRRFAILAALAAVLMSAPAAADDAARLVGTWRCNTTFDGFAAVDETVLMQGGAFSNLLRNQVGFMARHWGTYAVGDGVLRYVYEGHEPTRFCGPLGCQDLHLPDAETVLFRFVDDDTLQTAPSVCMAPPCGCTARRVR